MKHAAYCGTRNVYGDMEASAKSLVANTDVGKVHFLIEDAAFPRELPPIVECLDVSGQEFFAPGGPNMGSGFTYMAMMRIALCHVLPDVERVLSLDCDVFFMRDASAVWDLPIDDCYFAASGEWHRSKNGQLYCNHGVVLYNLAKLRDGKADECIEVLNRRRYTWVEQDVANYLCQGRIFDMPPTYNSNHWTDKGTDDNPAAVHFAGVKRAEWANRPEVVRYRDMTWDEAMARHDATVARHAT